MKSIWIVVVCYLVDLMKIKEGIPHVEETLECPSPPIYPQRDVQPCYIAVVQDNWMHKIHVLLESS